MYISEDIAEELIEGEEVLWSGAPIPSSAAKSVLPIFIFAIPWTLFSLFWEGAAIFGLAGVGKGSGFQWFKVIFPIFGLPFVLIGFTMLATPYIAYRKAKKTVYVITDRRVMTICNDKNRSVDSEEWKNIVSFSKTINRKGVGKLQFTTNIINNSSNKMHIFYGIYDIDEVEKIYYKMKEKQPKDI